MSETVKRSIGQVELEDAKGARQRYEQGVINGIALCLIRSKKPQSVGSRVIRSVK